MPSCAIMQAFTSVVCVAFRALKGGEGYGSGDRRRRSADRHSALSVAMARQNCRGAWICE